MSRRVEDRSYPLGLLSAVARQQAEDIEQQVNTLTAADIAFDGSGSSLVASNVEDAVKEVDAKTGGGGGGGLSEAQVRTRAFLRC